MERMTERVGKSIVVKGCKTIFAAAVRKGASLANAIIRLAEYEDTGTTPVEITDHEEMFAAYRHICAGLAPEQVAELKERAIPKRLVHQQLNRDGAVIGLCPACMGWWSLRRNHFCPNCGQALDWSETEKENQV